MQRTPLVIAHRGARNAAPENTLEAIRAALALGVDGIEFDVEITSDAQPVILHQETLELDVAAMRLQHASRDSGRDWVGAVTLNEIRKIDAGSWFDPKFAAVRIPTLEDVLSQAWGGIVPLVELKDPQYFASLRGVSDVRMICECVTPGLRAFLGRHGRLRVLSFNEEILEAIGSYIPGVARTWNLWTEWCGREHEALEKAETIGVKTVSLPDFMVLERPQWVQDLHARGLQCFVYPCTPAFDERAASSNAGEDSLKAAEPTWLRLIELRVDGIMSDYPEALLRLMRR